MEFPITEPDVGKRLDIAVLEHIPELSRAFIKRLCDDDKVAINDIPAKAGYKLRMGDTVTVDYDRTELGQIIDIDLPILYEDDDCVVINKPTGVLTHSKGAFNPEGTVASFLQSKIKDITGSRAGIVHRLDRATSGVIICAKTSAALGALQKQFATRKAKKTYIAITEGHLRPEHAIIDMPIERNPKKPQTFRIGPNGKSAITEYEVMKESKHFQMVTLSPQTGRTHQLRVHLAQQGHPIVGDALYGGRAADRMYLHALSLEITLPNRERKVFTAPLPEIFETVLEQDHV
jgi:23S rRNA pseudouridine1911/1915/1917 synthase